MICLVLIVLMVKIGFPLMPQTQSTQIQNQEQNIKPQSIPGKEVEPKMKKFPWLAVGLIAVAVVGVLAFVACKSPESPEPEPTKTEGIIELMYVRVLPIINPNGADPTWVSWCTYGLTDDGRLSGGDPLSLHSTGSNQWQCEHKFRSCQSCYYVWTGDGKVKNPGVTLAVAEKFFARIKGQQDWKELPVELNGLIDGKWAKFIYNQGVITIPSSSSFSK